MSKEYKRKRSFTNNKASKAKANEEGKKRYIKKDEDTQSSDSYQDNNDFKENKSRKGKDSNKPAFERFRDDSRPSDFGTSKKRTFKDYGNTRNEKSNEKPYIKKKVNDDKPSGFDKKERTFNKPKTIANPNDIDDSDLEYGKPKPAVVHTKKGNYIKKPYVKKTYSGNKKSASNPQRKEDDGMIRLNKYLANAGIASRREADDLISSGVVQVNGKTITEMGYRVKPTDIIKYAGQALKKERLVYFILNKPKDYLTTSDDPQKRRTVFELMKGTGKERIYPVGRLDRATTGLLMFTNDGELTKRLTHPKYGVRKIYHVEIDKPLKIQDFEKIKQGIELEDGEIKVDEISFVGDGKDKTQIGVELHSGKNRIVRRIFESFGYNVRKLDRVMFGSITKKDLPRGRWRLLTEAEIGILKMIGVK